MIKEIKLNRLEYLFRKHFSSMLLTTQTYPDTLLTKSYYTLPDQSLTYSIMLVVDEKQMEIRLYSNNLQKFNIGDDLPMGVIGDIISEKHGGGKFKVVVL